MATAWTRTGDTYTATQRQLMLIVENSDGLVALSDQRGHHVVISDRQDGAAAARDAIAMLQGLIAHLRSWRPEKLLYNVLEAVREGYDTSDLIAAHLQASRKSVARDLNSLTRCGTLTRLREPQVHAGRPSYRYRIVATNDAIVAR